MKTTFLCVILMVFSFGFESCKDNSGTDPGICSTYWATALADEAAAVSNAAVQYFNNPTVANCNAYKAAMQAYLDALEPYGECASLTGQDRAEWQAAIDNAQEDLDDFTCE